MTLNPPSSGNAHANVLTCAIGDVHGHIDKLEQLLTHCERRCAGQSTRLLFIGDYVDRGPDSRAVVELLRDLQRSRPGEVVCLRGNHEAVVLAAASDQLHRLPGGDVDMDMWLGPSGGGLATLASYGVAHASQLPADHLQWMATLPLSHDDGLRYFAHAGVHPDRPLSEQVPDDLLWIREPFLSHKGDFGRLIVHGHTPVSARVPDMRANRLNIDTGAGYGGPITAAIFDDRQRNPLAFLTNAGEIRMEAAAHG
jgi:serine/threonine protein phosphatase 1